MNTPAKEPRMYLILREDLAYKYIQGGHALAQYALEYPTLFKVWDNEYLICLSVFNGQMLREWPDKLEKAGLNYSVFYEPDLIGKRSEEFPDGVNYEYELPTAIAHFGNGEILSELRMATK